MLLQRPDCSWRKAVAVPARLAQCSRRPYPFQFLQQLKQSLMQQVTRPLPPCTDPYLPKLQVESKLFFLDARINDRGAYLKISEKSNSRSRSTVVVPAAGIAWFRELFKYYSGATDAQGCASELEECLV